MQERAGRLVALAKLITERREEGVQIIHEEDVARAIERALDPDVRGVFNLPGCIPAPLSVLLDMARSRGRPVPHPLAEALLRASLSPGAAAGPALGAAAIADVAAAWSALPAAAPQAAVAAGPGAPPLVEARGLRLRRGAEDSMPRPRTSPHESESGC